MLDTTIAGIRALSGTLPDTVFYTTDPNQQGIWDYDPTDTTSPDNTGTVLVTSDGKRIKRLLEDYLSALWFGAEPANALFDNSAIINATIEAADSLGCYVLIPEGNYSIFSPLYLRNCPLKGIVTKTIITMPETFTFDSGASPRNGACIYNFNYALTFSAATANIIFIDGIDFQSNAESSTTLSATLLLLGNVSSGEVSNCTFTAKVNTSAITNTLVDNYTCVKNVKYSSCIITNFNQNGLGGGMWVRNQTSAPTGALNVTENIRLTDVTMGQSGIVETLSIFGSAGLVTDVIVDKCTFNGLPTDIMHSVLVSVYPQNGSVTNVKIINSTFTDAYYVNYILRTGGSGSGDLTKTCDNILIDNNTFYAQAPSLENTQYVLLNVKNVGHVEATRNTIYCDNLIEYGISGYDKTAGNYIDAASTIGVGIANSTIVNDNVILAKSGVLDSDNVYDNKITGVQIGVERRKTGVSNINNNSMVLTGGSGITCFAFYIHMITAGNTPEMVIINNTVQIPDVANNTFLKSNIQTTQTALIGNKFTGVVNSPVINDPDTPLERVYGNVYNAIVEETRDTISFDVSDRYIKSLPLGYSFNKKTVTTNVIGFQKVSVATGTTADWQAIYSSVPLINTSTAATVSKSDLNTAYPPNTSTGVGTTGFTVFYIDLSGGAQVATKLDDLTTGNWLLSPITPAV